jgi:hypothetical protein
MIAQVSGKDAWAKRPVTANVDTSQENNERHIPANLQRAEDSPRY